MFNLIVLILVTIVFLMFGYLITHADIFSPFCVFCEMFLIAEFLCLFFVRMYKVEIHLKTILVIALGTISFGIVSAFFNMKRVDVRNYGEQHSRNYISINYLIQLVFLILEVLVVFYHAKYIKDVVAAFGYSKVKETILVVNEGTATIDYVPSRNNSRVAKAPQSFWLDDILKAHEKALSEGEKNCIDSCTMMQRYGYDLYLIDGPGENIKITTPEDFYTMRAILEAKENEQIYGLE